MYILTCWNFHNPCLGIWLTSLNKSCIATGMWISLYWYNVHSKSHVNQYTGSNVDIHANVSAYACTWEPAHMHACAHTQNTISLPVLIQWINCTMWFGHKCTKTYQNVRIICQQTFTVHPAWIHFLYDLQTGVLM